MIAKRLICLLSLLLATQADAMELTVEDCVRLGLQQSDSLKAIAAEVEINSQDASIAHAELMPSLSLESSLTLRDQPPRFTLESGLFGPGLPPQDARVEGEKEHYTLGVRLTQPLFAGGRLVGTHQSKTLLAEAHGYQLENQTSQLVYQIRRSYYQALIRQHELTGVTEAVSAQEEDLRIRKELLLAGRMTRAETLEAESRLLFAKADKLQAEQAFQNALEDLAATIGTNEAVMVVEPRFYSTLSPEFEIRRGEISQARKDLKRLDAQIGAADKNVQVARSGYYPQLNLEASYLSQRETDITEADIWEAGLLLEWPLFEAGKTDAEVARAKAEQQRLKHLRKALERSVDNEVRAALRLVRENEALVEAHRLQLQATEQEHSYLLELYHAGERKKLNVLSSRAKLALENAKYRAAINHLRISLAALETALSTQINDQLIPREAYDFSPLPLEDLPADPPSLPAPVTSPAPQGSASSPYSIQLAAFKSAERASPFLNKLQKDYPGKTFEIISAEGWHKVRAIHFASRDAVDAALVEFGGKGFIVHANTDH